MKNQHFKIAIVDSFPEPLAVGTLYVTGDRDVAAHLCACGCGKEVVTPLLATGWTLRLRGQRPSLDPSIGNWTLPCRSHYYITDGRVIWEAAMPQWAIDQGRARDRARKDQYYASKMPMPIEVGAQAPSPHALQSRSRSLWGRIWNWLHSLL